MTYSDCWLDAIDDDNFAAYVRDHDRPEIKRADKQHLLGPGPRGRYWINLVRDWGAARDLKVEYVDHLELRIRVSRNQLLDFLAFAYGDDLNSHAQGTVSFIRDTLKDGCTYWLCADEF
jgi:hypothetical protein